MKAKTKKPKAKVPFDPVLFAATVPGRKPTAIEPQQYESMDGMVEAL